MKFRWTAKELKEASDNKLVRSLIIERKSDLDPYSPLSKRLAELEKKYSHKLD